MAEASASAKKPLPVVDYLKIPDGGEPYLEGHKCQACGAVFLGARAVCSKCGTRGKIAGREAVERRARSTSTRSCTARSPASRCRTSRRSSTSTAAARVKGNLIDVEPDPEKIKFGMPVEVVYKDALGRKDREGNSYLSYFFQPRGR